MTLGGVQRCSTNLLAFLTSETSKLNQWNDHEIQSESSADFHGICGGQHLDRAVDGVNTKKWAALSDCNFSRVDTATFDDKSAGEGTS